MHEMSLAEGIRQIVEDAGRRQGFRIESCAACGAPLYPNPEGEPVHAELPEEQTEAAPRHLH